MRPSLSVRPGETEILPLIATNIPYKLMYRILSTFKNFNIRNNIKEEVRKSSIVISKSYKGKPVDIKCYILYHDDGLAMLYENNTSEYTITEELEFDLQDCHIEGVYGNYISFSVSSNNERLI